MRLYAVHPRTLMKGIQVITLTSKSVASALRSEKRRAPAEAWIGNTQHMTVHRLPTSHSAGHQDLRVGARNGMTVRLTISASCRAISKSTLAAEGAKVIESVYKICAIAICNRLLSLAVDRDNS